MQRTAEERSLLSAERSQKSKWRANEKQVYAGPLESRAGIATLRDHIEDRNRFACFIEMVVNRVAGSGNSKLATRE